MRKPICYKGNVRADFFIDENAVITDKDGNIQETYISRGRPVFRAMPIHRIMAFTFMEDFDPANDVHHENEDKLDNRISNLRQKPHDKHTSDHNLNRSSETTEKRSASLKGKNTWSTNLFWWSKPGFKSIRSYTKPGEGWERGRKSYIPSHKGKKYDKSTHTYVEVLDDRISSCNKRDI